MISNFAKLIIYDITQICFQAIGKTNVLKKNLRQFNGFEFDENSDEFEDRIESAQKMELAKLKAVCEGLRLDKKGTKDVICQRICKFLIVCKITNAKINICSIYIL